MSRGTCWRSCAEEVVPAEVQSTAHWRLYSTSLPYPALPDAAPGRVAIYFGWSWSTQQRKRAMWQRLRIHNRIQSLWSIIWCLWQGRQCRPLIYGAMHTNVTETDGALCTVEYSWQTLMRPASLCIDHNMELCSMCLRELRLLTPSRGTTWKKWSSGRLLVPYSWGTQAKQGSH